LGEDLHLPIFERPGLVFACKTTSPGYAITDPKTEFRTEIPYYVFLLWAFLTAAWAASLLCTLAAAAGAFSLCFTREVFEEVPQIRSTPHAPGGTPRLAEMRAAGPTRS